MEDIQVYELQRMDLRDATVVEGFPSVGLVSTISANYLISSLGLSQIGILDSVYFPTVSVVRNSEPLNPVRIYGGEITDKEGTKKPIVVFISEFQPPPKLIKLIAGTILDWIVEQKCGLLISPEGLVIERRQLQQTSIGKGLLNEKGATPGGLGIQRQAGDPQEENEVEGDIATAMTMNLKELEEASDLLSEAMDAPDISEDDEPDNGIEEGNREENGGSEEEDSDPFDVYGIASTQRGRELLENANIAPFTDGVVSGVAGVLLNEGKRRGFNVISLLAEAKPDFPDARATAKVIEAIDEIILQLGIDVEPLYKEAEDIENKIKMLRAQMEASKKIKPTTTPSMYG